MTMAFFSGWSGKIVSTGPAPKGRLLLFSWDLLDCCILPTFYCLFFIDPSDLPCHALAHSTRSSFTLACLLYSSFPILQFPCRQAPAFMHFRAAALLLPAHSCLLPFPPMLFAILFPRSTILPPTLCLYGVCFYGSHAHHARCRYCRCFWWMRDCCWYLFIVLPL